MLEKLWHELVLYNIQIEKVKLNKHSACKNSKIMFEDFFGIIGYLCGPLMLLDFILDCFTLEFYKIKCDENYMPFYFWIISLVSMCLPTIFATIYSIFSGSGVIFGFFHNITVPFYQLRFQGAFWREQLIYLSLEVLPQVCKS